jgi:hypothetical protein
MNTNPVSVSITPEVAVEVANNFVSIIQAQPTVEPGLIVAATAELDKLEQAITSKDPLKPVFKTERSAADPDVVEIVTDLLKQAGHPEPDKWQKCEKIIEAKAYEPKLQIVMINEHFRRELGHLEESTRTQRLALADDVDLPEYKNLFSKYVAPTLARTGI